ncbi:MAG TPA: ATP-binding protein, partial [Candidatus Saccharimonadales bacterium]|nr:ATP-binding protein [Candidatus Saccharimonadales bacterium]
MPRFQDISIKRKLTAIIMVACTVALFLVSAGFVTYDLATFRKTMARDLSTLAEIIGNQSTAALTYEDKETANEILAALSAEKHIVAAALYDKDGRLLASYSRQKDPAVVLPKQPEQEGLRFNKDALVLFHEIRLDGDFAGTLYLNSDLQAINGRFERYAAMILLFAILSLVVTLFLSGLLQRVISRPIVHLAGTARAVSGEKNYSVRATKHGDDELGQLIDSFNEMLGQIQRRDTELQQAHDKLEIRVAERTRDLRAEIAERQRTESELKRQFVRINMLNQITQAISERQNTDSLLHVVLRQLEDHLGLDLGLVALFDAKTRLLNVAALLAKEPSFAARLNLTEGSTLPLGETGFQRCEKGQTVYIADTSGASGPLAEKLAGTGWRSAVGVPLMLEENLFGVLMAARVKPDGFSSNDCEFLRMLSEHVALAAHQERLHKNLEKAYNELRQTQAAVLQQERLKALGQMASGIAHDVNNALSPVVGFSEIILNGGYGLNPEAKKYLKYIRTAGDDIAHIVARLREFYRARQVNEPLLALDLNALVEQVADMTRPRWRDIPQSKGITIEMRTELAPRVPKLTGIESEIREALTNLVLNAVDAMPDGGQITLRTRFLHREKDGGHPGQVVVEVSDTGIGMSEETRKRCLEPFFSTKGKRGTGLGLAMVYGVMERHEGSIEIQSEPGKGTTFCLIFPVRVKTGRNDEDKESKTVVEPLQ